MCSHMNWLVGNFDQSTNYFCKAHQILNDITDQPSILQFYIQSFYILSQSRNVEKLKSLLLESMDMNNNTEFKIISNFYKGWINENLDIREIQEGLKSTNITHFYLLYIQHVLNNSTKRKEIEYCNELMEKLTNNN